jgi:uncharacterized protein (DUF1778 family)
MALSKNAPIADAPERSGRKARKPLKAASLSIRVDDATCRFIDRGAEIAGQSRSEFMIASARQRTEELLLSRRVFVLSPTEWDAFNVALETPAPPNDALKALLSRRPAWQK